MTGRQYHRAYRPYGPPRAVPRLLFIPFPGHRTMKEVMADEQRGEQPETDQDEPA